MLSIVIPTLNEEELLPRLLRSLQAQTFTDYEVIVADAKSTDHTREMARSFGARVVEGGSPAIGRNTGAAVAKGDTLLFFDADVLLMTPTFLEELLASFAARGFGSATMFLTADQSNTTRLDDAAYFLYNWYIFLTQKIFPHGHGCCILVKKWVHEAVGGFDPSIKLGEDHAYVQQTAKISSYGVLTRSKIGLSNRRFLRDGHLRTIGRYILCEMRMWFLGPVKTDVFRYRFAHYDNSGIKKP